LDPSFISITYGAGGTTRERTHDLVVDILHQTTMTPMAHLTCVGHSRLELQRILERYRDAGVQNVLALRGDAPADLGLGAGDLRHAFELVELARDVGPFSIGVAAHPEGHPQSPHRTADRRHLAFKLRLADFAITQFFFRAEDYLSLVDDLAAFGVERPVIPGIMPVTNVAQVERFAALSGAELPVELRDRLHAVADDPVEVRRVGIGAATELCATLLAAGAPGLHFYTLNRSTATRQIWANLGLPLAQAA
jgi:methylenetetrahydrofolate reductase (NADPH)